MKVGRLRATSAADAVGWRVWRVDHDDDRTRLRSIVYGSLWPAGRPAQAECKRLHSSHIAPDPLCECGIYAAKDLEPWAHYLTVGAGDRVFGRVRVWGSLIEGSSGWRGERAYPLEIYVPVVTRDAEDVALGLDAYGVPVELAYPAAAKVLA